MNVAEVHHYNYWFSKPTNNRRNLENLAHLKKKSNEKGKRLHQTKPSSAPVVSASISPPEKLFAEWTKLLCIVVMTPNHKATRK